MVKEEQLALTHPKYKVDVSGQWEVVDRSTTAGSSPLTANHSPFTGDPLKFELWKTTNVFKQKQEGYFAVYVRVANGNISSDSSRRLIEKLKDVIADDVRVTINQGLQFRFIKA